MLTTSLVVLRPGVAALPQGFALFQSGDSVDKSAEFERGLRKDIAAAEVSTSDARRSTGVPGGLDIARLKLAIGKEVGGFGRARFIGDKPTGQKQCVFQQVVVEVVVDELSQLSRDVGIGRSHGCMRASGEDREDGEEEDEDKCALVAGEETQTG